MYGKSAHAHFAAESAADFGKVHEVPADCFMPPEHETLWRFVMTTKAYSSWLPTDLLLAARVVRCEVMIRNASVNLNKMIEDGADFCDPDSYACAYLDKLMKLEKHQLTALRALGMTRQSLQVESANKKSAAVKEANLVTEMLENSGMPGMLALPS